MNQANQPIPEAKSPYDKLYNLSLNVYNSLNKILQDPKELNELLNKESKKFLEFKILYKDCIEDLNDSTKFLKLWNLLIDATKDNNNKKLFEIYYYSANTKNHNFMSLLKPIVTLLPKDDESLNNESSDHQYLDDKFKDDDSLNDKILLSKLSNLLFRYDKSKKEHILPYEYIIDQFKELFKSKSPYIKNIINQKINMPFYSFNYTNSLSDKQKKEFSAYLQQENLGTQPTLSNWELVNLANKYFGQPTPAYFSANKIFNSPKPEDYVNHIKNLQKAFKEKSLTSDQESELNYLYNTGFLNKDYNIINNEYKKEQDTSNKNFIIRDHLTSALIYGNKKRNHHDSIQLRMADTDIKSKLNQFIAEPEKFISNKRSYIKTTLKVITAATVVYALYKNKDFLSQKLTALKNKLFKK